MNLGKSSTPLWHALFIGLMVWSGLANAHCLDQQRLTGVNLSGAEFNSSKLPGTPYKDYTFPTEHEITFIAAQGANVIRLPFRWERIQPKPMEALNDAELKRLESTVNYANSKNLCVILDIHNYAKYFGQPMAGDAAMQTAFVDLWQRLALVFNNPKETAFGLMNEPNYLPMEEWANLAKRTLAELRSASVTNIVLIGGGRWSGLHDWFSLQNGHSNATLFADVSDTLNRTLLEVHQYADSDYSGTGINCRAPDQFDPMFNKLTAWAKTHKQQLFMGEFGMPPTNECLLALERFLSLMTSLEWKGWTYWAAGGWWGKYSLAINTSFQEPSLQWPILKPYFYIAPTPAPMNSPPLAPQPRTAHPPHSRKI